MKKWLWGLILGAGLFLVGANVNANAATQSHYIAHYAKAMRGTWYYYDKGDGMVTLKITANKLITHGSKDKYGNGTLLLKRYKKHNPLKASAKTVKKTQNWVYGYQIGKKIHGYQWLNVQGWNATAGDGEYYNVHQFNGRQVLTLAGGADVWISNHAYRNAKVAKQLANHRYPGFKYYPGMV